MAPFDDAEADLGNVSGDDNGDADQGDDNGENNVDDNGDDRMDDGHDGDDGICGVSSEGSRDDDPCVDDLLDLIEGVETGGGCEDHVMVVADTIEEFPNDSQNLSGPDDPIEDEPPLENEEHGKKDNTHDALVQRPVARPLLNEVNPKSLPHDPSDDFGDAVEDDEHAIALVEKHVARTLFNRSSSSSGASASSSSVPPSNEKASRVQALMSQMKRLQAQMDALASVHPSYFRFMLESMITPFMSWTCI